MENIMKKKMSLRFAKAFLIVGLGLFATACSSNYHNIDMESPSLRMDDKLKMSQTKVKKAWPVTVQSDPVVKAMANDYKGRGDGPVQVMVTYAANECPRIEGENREKAAGQAHGIRQILSSEGVKNVDVRVAPVPEEKAGMTVVSYDAMIVQQPEKCRGKSLIGVDGHIDNALDYPIGCDNQKYMARMVSNKKDLLGRSEMDPASSSYLGAAMEGYQAGDTVGEDDLDVTTTQLSTAGQ